jgi:hypothetical protein
MKAEEVYKILVHSLKNKVQVLSGVALKRGHASRKAAKDLVRGQLSSVRW